VLLGYLVSSQVSQSFHNSVWRLMLYDEHGAQRLRQVAETTTGPLALAQNRNELAKLTLESGADWLFMVDADMGFAPDTLERLLADADPAARPVIGALCFSHRNARPDGMGGFDTFCSPTIMQRLLWDDGIWRFTGSEHYPVNALVRCGATGAACILIHRTALLRVREAVGETWFTRTPDGAGQLQGEDVSFCERLFELDIPLYVDTGVRTTHCKPIWLSETDFWQMRVAPPATERVDVIVPVLHRPENVPTLLRSLRASTGLAECYFVCEPEDDEEIAAVLAEGGRVLRFPGTFARKVNHAYGLTDAPWLLLVGDDVRFRPGWLDQALNIAERYHADVVGTNDLLNIRVIRGEHATHPLIRRAYVSRVGASWDGPGIVCHEGYRHWFVDDEITVAAQLRGVFQAALGSHVEHLHDGSVPEGVEADQALFRQRCATALREREAEAV
jgi:GT2 family glycosyltransferase